jgi:hypothetical protein
MRTARSLALVLMVAVACGGPAATPPATGVTSLPTATAAASAASAVPPATPSNVAAATPAPILRFALTDVRTGERFTLSSFAGRTVIVQGMAVW